MIEPTKDPNYIILKPGDTIQENDEYWSNGSQTWLLTSRYVGSEIISGDFQYRRKIKHNSDYRLLNAGEIIQKGDECLFGENKPWEHWDISGCAGNKIKENGRYCDMLYRRKIKTETKVPTEKLLKDAQTALQNLQEKHAQIITECDNLVSKIKELSNENKKLQHGINSRNERIADLEFAIRKIRKGAS